MSDAAESSVDRQLHVMSTAPDEPDPPDFMLINLDAHEMAERFDRLNDTMRRLREALMAYYQLPDFTVQRGGVQYGKPDPRIGQHVEVRDLVPGDRVFILEGVFTVHRVDMKAPIPTVWLEELPDSPLYFAHTDYIPLAIETED